MDNNCIVKIPVGLPTKVVRSTWLNKLVSTYLSLKMLTTSGAIKSYTTRIEELSSYCGIRKSTFYTRLNYLEDLGLLSRKHGVLTLSSYEKLLKTSGVAASGKWHRVPLSAKLELTMRALAEKEHLEKQRFYAKEKFYKQNSLICKNKEGFDFNLLKQLQISAFENSHHCIDAHVNPIFTISQKTRGNVYGNKSRQLGGYWERRLEQEKLIKVTEPPLIWSNGWSAKSHLGRVYFNNKKKLNCLQLPKQIDVIC